MDVHDGGPQARRKKLHVYAKRLGLTRQDRLDIAGMLLARDIGSWKDLTDADVDRLLDGFEGYLLVSYTLMDRRS